jgi:predicted GNAT family acetyltransferase
MPEPKIAVVDDPPARRYQILVDDAPAGFAAYQLLGDQIVFTHTEIDSAYEGQGLGARLAAAALDDIRSRGLRVVAQCPFIAGYIRRHPDYQELLA